MALEGQEVCGCLKATKGKRGHHGLVLLSVEKLLATTWV